MQITTIGLDLAKNVFQVHGIDATGQVVVRRSLRRSQMLPFFAKLRACLVGMEACGTSHYWARELVKLGHDVRLMPPAYVKPYVKRGKTDAADAEAVCEAVTRPTMRFVPVKSPEQQAALSMHRTRDLLVKQRTQLINMIRGLLAEFGVDIPKGLERALLMARQIVDGKAPEVPIEAAKIVTTLSQQALDIHVRLREIDRDLAACLRGNDVASRLMTRSSSTLRHRSPRSFHARCRSVLRRRWSGSPRPIPNTRRPTERCRTRTTVRRTAARWDRVASCAKYLGVAFRHWRRR